MPFVSSLVETRHDRSVGIRRVSVVTIIVRRKRVADLDSGVTLPDNALCYNSPAPITRGHAYEQPPPRLGFVKVFRTYIVPGAVDASDVRAVRPKGEIVRRPYTETARTKANINTIAADGPFNSEVSLFTAGSIRALTSPWIPAMCPGGHFRRSIVCAADYRQLPSADAIYVFPAFFAIRRRRRNGKRALQSLWTSFVTRRAYKNMVAGIYERLSLIKMKKTRRYVGEPGYV